MRQEPERKRKTDDDDDRLVRAKSNMIDRWQTESFVKWLLDASGSSSIGALEERLRELLWPGEGRAANGLFRRYRRGDDAMKLWIESDKSRSFVQVAELLVPGSIQRFTDPLFAMLDELHWWWFPDDIALDRFLKRTGAERRLGCLHPLAVSEHCISRVRRIRFMLAQASGELNEYFEEIEPYVLVRRDQLIEEIQRVADDASPRSFRIALALTMEAGALENEKARRVGAVKLGTLSASLGSDCYLAPFINEIQLMVDACLGSEQTYLAA